MYPITFVPLFKERVWGGRRMAELFHKALPSGSTFGESWEITDRPEGVSQVANGPFAGRNLRWLMETHGPDLLGRPPAPQERFPWLVKILDARDDLSLQVHPPDALAAALAGEPKTELWYFAATNPGARIYVGLKPGITRDEFRKRVDDGSVAGCFHIEKPVPGDVMFIPSGRVHALGAGNVIFEIQQNSDTTYRVFDWHRPGLDGRPRELHVEPSMASIDFEDIAPGLVHTAWHQNGPISRRPLVRHSVFAIDEYRTSASTRVPDSRPPGACGIVAVIRGNLRATGGGETVELGAGGFVLLPAALHDAILEAADGTTLLSVSPPEPAIPIP